MHSELSLLCKLFPCSSLLLRCCCASLSHTGTISPRTAVSYDTLVPSLCRELPPFFLGGITLAPDSPAAPAASGEPLRHVIVDGQERIFALLLLLAAAREHLATDLHLLGALSGSSILPRDLMQQAGALLSPVRSRS